MSADDKRLPRAAYTDKAWHTRETESLFDDAWSFAGLTSDFNASGDYLSLSAGAFPLAVLRGDGDKLSGFHNLCRHRGAVLLEGRDNVGSSLVCPYHRWTYGLDGSLRGVPNQASCFPDLDRLAHGLKPATLGIFRKHISINPNPAADFESWIAPIAERAWPHRPGEPGMREEPVLRYAIKCNWKVCVENALDGYHLAILHKNTLGGPPPQNNLWERLGQHMVWHATDTGGIRHPLPAQAREYYRQAGAIPLAGAEAADYGGVYYLFPKALLYLANPQLAAGSANII